MKNQSALEHARTLLTAQGFRKRASDVYTFELSEGWLAWLGLNTAHRSGGVFEINPVFGIRHQELERCVAELCGSPFHAYSPPTVSIHLGYLLPSKSYTPCLIVSEATAAAAVEEFVHQVVSIALPLARAACTLDDLLELLRTRWKGFPEQSKTRIAVALLLLGRTQECAQFVDALAAEVERRPGLAAAARRSFCKTIRARL